MAFSTVAADLETQKKSRNNNNIYFTKRQVNQKGNHRRSENLQLRRSEKSESFAGGQQKMIGRETQDKKTKDKNW